MSIFGAVVLRLGMLSMISLPGCSNRQHVPLEEYKSNLEKIVNYVKGIGCKNIVLITPPPVDDAAWKEFREVREIRVNITDIQSLSMSFLPSIFIGREPRSQFTMP